MTFPGGPQPSGSPPDPQRSLESRRRRENIIAAFDALSNGIAGGARVPIGDSDLLPAGDPAAGEFIADLGQQPSGLVGDQPVDIETLTPETPDLAESLAAAGIDTPSGADLIDTSGLPSHADVVDAAQGLVNGKIPKSELTRISGANPNYRAGILLDPAAKSWEAMLKAAAADGVRLYHSDTYRSWETQNAAYLAYRRGERGPGIIVAPPGTSKHGAGLAIDMTDGKGILSKSTAQWQWLSQNGARFGWYGISSEAWHWEYRGL